MRNKIYAKNTEYIACSQNLSKNLHFRKTFVYLSVSRQCSEPQKPTDKPTKTEIKIVNLRLNKLTIN